MLAHVGPNGPHVGPQWAPSWHMLVPVGPSKLKLAPRCSPDGPKLAHVGPCWPQVGAIMGHLSCCKAPHGRYVLQGAPKTSQGIHEGSASKAWVFQGVHEGSASGVPTFDCSFGLLHPLAFDLEGCSFLALLLACPVMADLSKRFIQTFLSSGFCKQLLLEVSFFFWHCTKAL